MNAPQHQTKRERDYDAFVESMVQHCRCAHDRPCDGVLAGGLCDDIQDHERESIFDDADDEI